MGMGEADAGWEVGRKWGGGRVQRRANPPGSRKAEEVLTVPERGGLSALSP